MARGIIKQKPGGMTSGRIIVTESDPTGDFGVGNPGTEVEYTEGTSELGDVVNFRYDGRSCSGVITEISGTVITGDYAPNIDIARGQSVLITAGILRGVLITVNGGYLTIANNTEIRGRITSATDGSTITIDVGTSMNGNLDVPNASTLSVKGSTTAGSINSNNNIYATVTDCIIRGSLSVTNARACCCSGNTVSGNDNSAACRC